jgi:hypothetical protein
MGALKRLWHSFYWQVIKGESVAEYEHRIFIDKCMAIAARDIPGYKMRRPVIRNMNGAGDVLSIKGRNHD